MGMSMRKVSLLIRKHEIFDKKPDYLNLLFMRIVIALYLNEAVYISACRYWDNDRLYIDMRFLVWNIHLSWDPFDDFWQDRKCSIGIHRFDDEIEWDIPVRPLPGPYPKTLYKTCLHCGEIFIVSEELNSLQ